MVGVKAMLGRVVGGEGHAGEGGQVQGHAAEGGGVRAVLGRVVG